MFVVVTLFVIIYYVCTGIRALCAYNIPKWHVCTTHSPMYITGTYLPRKEVVVEETIRATVIRPNQSIRLRARKETLDRDGNPRVTGEEWMVLKVGAYLPGAYEEVVDVVDAYVLTEKVCYFFWITSFDLKIFSFLIQASCVLPLVIS